MCPTSAKEMDKTSLQEGVGVALAVGVRVGVYVEGTEVAVKGRLAACVQVGRNVGLGNGVLLGASESVISCSCVALDFRAGNPSLLINSSRLLSKFGRPAPAIAYII